MKNIWLLHSLPYFSFELNEHPSNLPGDYRWFLKQPKIELFSSHSGGVYIIFLCKGTTTLNCVSFYSEEIALTVYFVFNIGDVFKKKTCKFPPTDYSYHSFGKNKTAAKDVKLNDNRDIKCT